VSCGSYSCIRYIEPFATRLQAIATPLVPSMDKVQIIPPPKEVDPRVLAWKGAAVLGKMDSVADLWLTPMDWVCARLPHQCFGLTLLFRIF
jgi:actin-related protein